MSDTRQARELVEAAERDVSALRGMGNAAVFSDEIFGFHAQQAVEKLLKAWLALLGKIYPRIHDLTELLEMVKTRDPSAARFDALVEFTPYAVQFRYGVGDSGAALLDRDTAVRQVEKLLRHVRARITRG